MKTVIGVKFKDGGKVYDFDPGELEIREGDGVIVETARGVEFGDVARGPHEVEDFQIVGELKPVQRVASEQDRAQRDRNRAREKEAFGVCAQKIQEHGLDMKLVDVEYTFNGSKVVFYFTADGRVDFRDLVKDLAGVFKTRIELRQIGVRDEAKMLGGLGSCGRPVCCQAFLADFQPVSIKMAKEQNLSLSPTKISGICSRLMCCLKYEQDCYESMRKQMPKVGKEVGTPDGPGVAVENNVITERTKVRVNLADGTYDVREYPFRELDFPQRGKQSQGAAEAAEPAPQAAQAAPAPEGKDQSTPPPRRERPDKPRPERRQPDKRREAVPVPAAQPECKEQPEAGQAAPDGEQAPKKRRRSRGGRGRRHHKPQDGTAQTDGGNGSNTQGESAD